MTAGSPEVRHRGADGRVVLAGVLVDVAGVRDLSLGGRIDTVNLAARERSKLLHAELLG